MVFFDWSSDELTPTADKTISRFLSDNTASSLKEIYISGFTDSSGLAADNVTLSFKRAQAVAKQLISHGIPKDKIEVFAYGDAHMLVPTLANVRMPQNRRVEIMAYPVGTPVPAEPYAVGPTKVIRLKNGILID